VRADRLVSLVLLLQARGCVTGRALAAELGVSVRTVYRDLGALGAAGVPVITESGPGGGCRLLDGYRFPLRGLRADEAEALLILGVPAALRDLGLGRSLSAAHRQIQVTSGAAPGALVHLDMPRWFGSREEVPCLRDLAGALRLGRKLRLAYRHADGREDEPRAVGPLGLVNKAGTWYLVALVSDGRGEPRVFRAGRIGGAVILAEPFPRPPGFGLAEFWDRWSAEFEASRPRIAVTLRASPGAQAAFAEVFGDAAGPALASAAPPGADGWRTVTLSFEHEVAAAYRLAGFGDQVEVLSPPPVRDRLVRTARQILTRYSAAVGEPPLPALEVNLTCPLCHIRTIPRLLFRLMVAQDRLAVTQDHCGTRACRHYHQA
jgi:predicted DNA-binding transcriptional regulator YafY